ncbi:MAG: phosphatase PAP2 family protein [Caulobacteraceae bacterium]|nr:MAG: phosphatase PAP2 family protein [Caulobacteraceae bacterium]
MAVKGLARGALIVAGVAMLGCGAVAQDAKSPVAAPRPAGGYLAPALLPDSLSIVGAPPAPDSDQARADRAAFDASRALEGSPRWSQAIADVELFGDKAHRSFSCAIGKEISAAKTPVLSKLLDRLVLDAGGSTSAAKKKYQRDRPMIGHDEAKLCVVREDWMKTNGSYPSGHAAAGMAWGLVLAELAPDKASAAVTRGREFGDSRWICGVHFQSDVSAGQVMAAATFARLHAEPAFTADMALAKAELDKAPAPEGCGV